MDKDFFFVNKARETNFWSVGALETWTKKGSCHNIGVFDWTDSKKYLESAGVFFLSS